MSHYGYFAMSMVAIEDEVGVSQTVATLFLADRVKKKRPVGIQT
jgi:hypothetical protein